LASPTTYHLWLPEFGKKVNQKGGEVLVLTQNVDSLESRSGMVSYPYDCESPLKSQVINLHGTLLQTKCSKNGTHVIKSTQDEGSASFGDKCKICKSGANSTKRTGENLRQSTGQMLPDVHYPNEGDHPSGELFEEACSKVLSSGKSVFIIVGTSLSHVKIRSFAQRISRKCSNVFVVDPEYNSSFKVVLEANPMPQHIKMTANLFSQKMIGLFAADFVGEGSPSTYVESLLLAEQEEDLPLLEKHKFKRVAAAMASSPALTSALSSDNLTPVLDFGTRRPSKVPFRVVHNAILVHEQLKELRCGSLHGKQK
jgi:NAD-dependent SIR2 family protein deacetylase